MASLLTLRWVKDASNAWYDLQSPIVTRAWASGVYVIWKGAAPGTVQCERGRRAETVALIDAANAD